MSLHTEYAMCSFINSMPLASKHEPWTETSHEYGLPPSAVASRVEPSTMSPYLSDAEIEDICAPLVMPSAQRRHLARLGMVVKAKPNGRPLVARGEFERVMIGRQPEASLTAASEPNRAALLQVLSGGKSSGTKT